MARGMCLQNLCRRAQDDFESSPLSQRDVARALGVNVSSVSRALRKSGRKHAAMLARIVSYLEGVPVQRRSTYEGSFVTHRWVVDP